MATTNAVKDEYNVLVEAEHSHDHDHAPFIAHHFDTAEQQFDSGKLGIWLFLITEVLFFSGLFVAYIIYRYNRPEVFLDAHVHLDKFLGGINTIVLLFSSLTMAWAVRASQMGNNRTTATSVLLTMVCAAAFLGVKAVEYSHKWDIGLLPGDMFSYVEGAAHPEAMISPYLVGLSSPFALLLVGFTVASVFFWNTGSKLVGQFMAGMAITSLGFFLGVAGGIGYMAAFTGGHDSHGNGHGNGHGDDHSDDHGAVHAMMDSAPVPSAAISENSGDQPTQTIYVTTNTVQLQDGTAGESQQDPEVKPADDQAEADHSEADHSEADHAAADHPAESVPGAATSGTVAPGGTMANQASDVPDKSLGVFFSIYYCMTGLHAVHILGGIVALAWIYYRSLAMHWRPDYFGPVDFVGLYWHLVDLIWIYLFPLMYLIK